MGLRRRVSLGFISIVTVLILSGMISFFELSILSTDTDSILETSRRNNEQAQLMLNSVRQHNIAFVRMSAFQDRTANSSCIEALDRLDTILIRVHAETMTPVEIDSIMVTAAQLRTLSEDLIVAPAFDVRYEALREEFPEIDSLARDFAKSSYFDYLPLHDRIVEQIDNFMTLSQESLAPGTKRLHNNAYRAVTPVLISLIVMIAIVLMLYFFVLIYCVKPVVEINRSLKNFIAFRVPFAPKSQNIDELKELCERIDSIVKKGNTNNQ